MQFNISIKSSFALLSAISFIQALANPAQSQVQQYSSTQSEALKKANPLKFDPMKQRQDLPDLPDFTGKAKFVHGAIYQHPKGPNYIEYFNTEEEASLVIDWYKNTLNMYKWKITGQSNKSVTAEKDGSMCAISVNDLPKSSAPIRTELQINYFQMMR